MSGRRRHLAYVLKRFPRISETFIAAELIELERQGEQLTVFALINPAEPFAHAFLDQLKAPVVYLPARPIREPLRVARAVGWTFARSPLSCLRALRNAIGRRASRRLLVHAIVLRAEMARAGIDHAHAHFATEGSELARLARLLGGPTYSVTTHAKDIYHEQVMPEDLRWKLGEAVFVATVSEGNRQHLNAVLRADGRVRVVPNSVDLRRLGPVERSPEPGLVVSVARLVEKKGLADLVAACGILRASGLPVRLVVAGDGPLRSELEAAAASAGLEQPFIGALPYEQVWDLYRRASVFCLPCVIASTGDRDGLPTSVLEAMALGIPVVTTAVNGLADAVLDHKTGMIVPEHDADALADALRRVLEDDALATRLAEEGRRHVERSFSLEQSVSLLRTLFPEPV